MKIRKAKKGDLKHIKKIISLYRKHLIQSPLPKINSFFVAEHNGKIVGCCALDVYSKKIAEIRSLAVLKNHQGRGIATALVEACLKIAKRKRIREVLAITGRVGLFGRLGFSNVHEWRYAVFKNLR